MGVSLRTLTRAARAAPASPQMAVVKHFFPCNEGGGNVLRCAKTGLQWDASAGGDMLTWGTVKNTVRSAANGSAPPINFTNPSLLASLDAGKYWVFALAGRVIGNYGCRLAWGDNNQLIYNPGYGFGLSDSVPSIDGTFHAAIKTASTYPDFYKLSVDTSSTTKNVASATAATDQINIPAHGFTEGMAVAYKAVSGQITSNPALVSGSYYYVHVIDANNIQLSATKGGAIIDITADTTPIVVQMGPGASLFVNNAGIDVVVYAHFTPGVGITAYKAINLDTGAVIYSASVVDNSAVPTGTVNFNPAMRFSGYDLYGCALFQSKAALPNLETGLKAMALDWRAGRKEIYGGWISEAA